MPFLGKLNFKKISGRSNAVIFDQHPADKTGNPNITNMLTSPSTV